VPVTYLGRGWFCPLVESRIIRGDFDIALRVILPTGKALNMLLDDPYTLHDADPGPVKFHSADGRWHGTLSGESPRSAADAWTYVQKNGTRHYGDTFVLTSEADGWEYTFIHNRIQQWKTGDKILEWIYQGDLVSEIRLKGTTGKAPFSVTLDAGGHTDGFVVNDQAHHFKFAPFPLTHAFLFGWSGNFESVGYTGTEWIPGDNRSLITYSVGTEPGFTLTFHDKQGIATLCTSHFTGVQIVPVADHLGPGWQGIFPGAQSFDINTVDYSVTSSKKDLPVAIQSADKKWHGTWQPDTDTFVLKSDTEGCEITYLHGIRQWKNGTHVVQWIYDKDNNLTEIQVMGASGKAALGVVLDAGGRPEGFNMISRIAYFQNTKNHHAEILFDYSATPTLSGWDGPGGLRETYAFATDSGSPPTITVTDSHGIAFQCSWNPYTRQIVSADGWNYIAPYVRDERDFAPLITRINDRGEYEYTAPTPRPEANFTSIVSSSLVTVAKTLRDGTTISTRLRRAGVVCDEIQKVETVGPDGIYHLTYVADFDDAGSIIREFKVDSKGTATLATYAGDAPAKNETLSGPDAIPVAREKALMADVEKSNGVQRDLVLEQLAYFYIDAGDFNKALASARQIGSRDMFRVICMDVIAADKNIPKGWEREEFQQLLEGGSLPKLDKAGTRELSGKEDE
jgi:hypothetical protein